MVSQPLENLVAQMGVICELGNLLIIITNLLQRQLVTIFSRKRGVIIKDEEQVVVIFFPKSAPFPFWTNRRTDFFLSC
jgi:hypothetical protein